MKKKILIEGMSCGHCVNHVEGALEDIGGENIEVNLEGKYATVEFNNNSTEEDIKAAIEDAGYDVVKIETI
ncbi:cation transporter [Clostridium sp. MSJ-11]|uniref:Cation transporter n=1 Tax=Clostridium mobile TaxID=2841512 RepID=A0ABS6EHT1_9CLOT|nr:cation transporter [Clostridium mobile]MBU5484799.1 cation transporter [Clostridium mobile]